MLRSILSIAVLHVRLVLSNRGVFFFSLVMPIVFTAFMGQANVTGFGSAAGANRRLEVVSADRGALATQLAATLRAGGHWRVEETSLEAALERVRAGRSTAALIIPADFTDAATGGRRPALDLRTDEGAPDEARRAERDVRAAADKVLAEARGAETAARSAGPAAESAGAPSPEPAAGAKSGAEQSSPGVIVIFALLFAVSGTNVLIWERQTGTLRRLLVTPAGRASVLLGKVLGIYFIGVVQISLLILAGALLFGVAWGRSPAALALMVAGFALVATSMGVLLATLVKTVAQADAMASMAVMAVSALGGAWWPLDAAPRWMQTVGHLFPTAWAMDGFRDIVVGQQSVAGVLPEFGVLLGFAALFLTAGLLRFRYQ